MQPSIRSAKLVGMLALAGFLALAPRPAAAIGPGKGAASIPSARSTYWGARAPESAASKRRYSPMRRLRSLFGASPSSVSSAPEEAPSPFGIDRATGRTSALNSRPWMTPTR